jgi:hypothetical protein
VIRLSEYKKKRDVDKRKANFKTLGNNGAISDNRGGQTAYLAAENLGVKVTDWQTQALTTPLYLTVLWRTQGSVASLSRSRCCRSLSCLLCDATNETSVSAMLCRDNKNVCKHCNEYFTVLETRGDPRRKQSQANLLTVVSLCLILSGAHRGHRTSLAARLDRDFSCFMLNSVG